jgi:hypothetical protein
MTQLMENGDPGFQLRATDVLLSALQHDPAPLRSFMLHQEDRKLFTLLVESLIRGDSGGLQDQVGAPSLKNREGALAHVSACDPAAVSIPGCTALSVFLSVLSGGGDCVL